MTLFSRNLVKKYFSKDDLKSIKGAITEFEKRTSAELRIKIISKINKGLAGDIFAQAAMEFVKEGMDKTRDQTGVLILIALDDRKFQILADKGIMAKIKQEVLDRAASIIKSGFQGGTQREGLHMAVGFLGGIFSEHFPKKSDDKNELPNDVIIEKEKKEEGKK